MPTLNNRGFYLRADGRPSNFTMTETRCRCGDCQFFLVSQDVIDLAQRLRDQFGPLHVLSAVRCPAHNRAVGGAVQSRHLPDEARIGHALDLTSRTVDPDTLADQFEAWYPNQFGLGRYRTFIHIDDRPNRARW